MPTIEEIIAAAKTHPLGVFMEAYQGARDKLVDERIEQKEILTDGNASPGQISAAGSAVTELISAIGELDEARTAFLVQVFTGVIPPSPELVQATRKLNSDLADATTKANKPGVYLAIVTDYLTAATQVITGEVPPVN